MDGFMWVQNLISNMFHYFERSYRNIKIAYTFKITWKFWRSHTLHSYLFLTISEKKFLSWANSTLVLQVVRVGAKMSAHQVVCILWRSIFLESNSYFRGSFPSSLNLPMKADLVSSSFSFSRRCFYPCLIPQQPSTLWWDTNAVESSPSTLYPYL